ncbi:Beta-1,3-galactosyltransferase 4, partial [Lamellibrachia satsuma]
PVCIDDALLVILITSAPDHVVQRSAIRRTWCATAESAPASLRFQCVFLVGATGNEVTERAVRAEMAAHRDIAKGTFVDSYRNLTSKVLAGFHWCSSNCTSRFVLKTDDDCFVNVAVLLRLLAVQPDDDLYVGKIAEDTRVIRNVDSPWAVSEHEYPPLYYPAYASGTGYVLSYSAMRKILTESRRLRAFPNEDAYVGVLADQVRIVPTNSYRFTFVSDKWAVCNYRYLVVIHRVSADRQRVQLDMARRSTTECRHQKFITTW